jgi:hypothetical protein
MSSSESGTTTLMPSAKARVVFGRMQTLQQRWFTTRGMKSCQQSAAAAAVFLRNAASDRCCSNDAALEANVGQALVAKL